MTRQAVTGQATEALFHDPHADAVCEPVEAGGVPVELDSSQLTPGRTSEEIHRTLFSAR